MCPLLLLLKDEGNFFSHKCSYSNDCLTFQLSYATQRCHLPRRKTDSPEWSGWHCCNPIRLEIDDERCALAVYTTVRGYECNHWKFHLLQNTCLTRFFFKKKKISYALSSTFNPVCDVKPKHEDSLQKDVTVLDKLICLSKGTFHNHLYRNKKRMTSNHCHTTGFSYVVAILKTSLVFVIGWFKWYIALHRSAWYLCSIVDYLLASSLWERPRSRRVHRLDDLQYSGAVSAPLAKPLSILNEVLTATIPLGSHSFGCVTVRARDRLRLSLVQERISL